MDVTAHETTVHRIDVALLKLRKHRKALGKNLRKRTYLGGWKCLLSWAYRIGWYQQHVRTQRWVLICKNPIKHDFGSHGDRNNTDRTDYSFREGYLSLAVDGNGSLIVVGDITYESFTAYRSQTATTRTTGPVNDISVDGYSLAKWGFDPLMVESAVLQVCSEFE